MVRLIQTRQLLYHLTIPSERLRTHIISCDAVKRLIETLQGPNSDEVVITLSWLAEDGMLCLEWSYRRS